jgi:serine/threonine protein phosphatase PrpC
VRIRVGVATDVGRVREHNEDGYLAEAPVFAVADGMGGHRGGEVASQVALERLDEVHRRGDVALPEAVRQANRAVLERAEREEALSGMGTTITALLAKGDGIELAHVGDSRAYLLRDGQLRQLTEDHTLVHRMVLEGKLTEDEARIHPHRSILTRALGVEANVEIDGATLDVRPRDRVLLCSDGLTSMVGDDAIHEILASARDPQEASLALVAAANEAGGQDNITALVLDFEEGEGIEVLGEDAGPPAVGAPDAKAAPREHPTPRRRRRGRIALWTAVALLLVAAALVGGRLYLDRQWFVGVTGGHVGLFRGIPAEVLGFDLFSLTEETEILAADAMSLGPWTGLDEGITAGSEDEARAIIRQIAADLREQERAGGAPQDAPPDEPGPSG